MILADAGAAHSMDTDWYGVDKAGNVARLATTDSFDPLQWFDCQTYGG